jgi:hypothetical protein
LIIRKLVSDQRIHHRHNFIIPQHE